MVGSTPRRSVTASPEHCPASVRCTLLRASGRQLAAGRRLAHSVAGVDHGILDLVQGPAAATALATASAAVCTVRARAGTSRAGQGSPPRRDGRSAGRAVGGQEAGPLSGASRPQANQAAGRARSQAGSPRPRSSTSMSSQGPSGAGCRTSWPRWRSPWQRARGAGCGRLVAGPGGQRGPGAQRRGRRRGAGPAAPQPRDGAGRLGGAAHRRERGGAGGGGAACSRARRVAGRLPGGGVGVVAVHGGAVRPEGDEAAVQVRRRPRVERRQQDAGRGAAATASRAASSAGSVSGAWALATVSPCRTTVPSARSASTRLASRRRRPPARPVGRGRVRRRAGRHGWRASTVSVEAALAVCVAAVPPVRVFPTASLRGLDRGKARQWVRRERAGIRECPRSSPAARAFCRPPHPRPHGVSWPDVPARTALPGLGRRSAPQHHAHGRRLCDHCFPAAEDDHEQGCQREDHGRRHQGMARAGRADAERGEPASLRADMVRGAVSAMVPLLTASMWCWQRRASDLGGRVLPPAA